jgi:hypothetical protein
MFENLGPVEDEFAAYRTWAANAGEYGSILNVVHPKIGSGGQKVAEADFGELLDDLLIMHPIGVIPSIEADEWWGIALSPVSLAAVDPLDIPAVGFSVANFPAVAPDTGHFILDLSAEIPIVPRSFEAITDTGQVVFDDGGGNIRGDIDSGETNTINYSTGAVEFTVNSTLAADVDYRWVRGPFNNGLWVWTSTTIAGAPAPQSEDRFLHPIFPTRIIRPGSYRYCAFFSTQSMDINQLTASALIERKTARLNKIFITS